MSRADNLKDQIDCVRDEYRDKVDNGIKTADRYSKACYRFADWLGENTNIQKFENVRSEHLVNYVESLNDEDKKPSYIKTELSAIRGFHKIAGEMSGKRNPNILMSNEQINEKYSNDNDEKLIDKRQIGGVNRVWDKQEIEDFKSVAESLGNQRVSLMVDLAHNFGCRLDEMVRLNQTDIKNALREDNLHVTGKGGKEREIPKLTLVQQETLINIKSYMDNTDLRGGKVFVLEEEDYKKAYNHAKDFLNNHREKFQDPTRVSNTEAREQQKQGFVEKSNLGWHGLRHTYAVDRMYALMEEKSYIKDYKDRLESAMKDLTQEIGHNRTDVTKVYIGAVFCK